VRPNLLPALALTSVAALTLAGCAAGSPGDAGSASSDGGISIVASTDVWGDVASVVAGDGVTVTSIIDSPDKDPHEYEATSRDQLAVSRASLIVENGGGYDPFIDTLREASNSSAPVVSAVEVSGLATEDDHADEATPGAAETPAAGDHAEDDHGHIEGFNEHVFYDLHTAAKVADAVAEQLAAIDPANADGYRDRAQDFDERIGGLETDAEAFSAQASGRGALVTEPVPLYLLAEMGVDNLTPASFSEAVEEDSDVAPADLQTVLTLITDGKASMLAYNAQATTSQTETVRTAAEAAGVPVVNFTETLPEGETYLDWMSANIDAVKAALGG
jgi:zinc/manganese transport system substrate-binding protein